MHCFMLSRMYYCIIPFVIQLNGKPSISAPPFILKQINDNNIASLLEMRTYKVFISKVSLFI